RIRGSRADNAWRVTVVGRLRDIQTRRLLPMKFKLSGPAFVLALIALFVALSGGAVAAGIVPLARHAITAGTAGNALKLGGKTRAQLAQRFRGAPGPHGLRRPGGRGG